MSGILKSAPGEYELYDLLVDISSQWHEIGITLRLSFNTLEGLNKSQGSDNVKLARVIHSWITTSDQKLVTWGTVIAALERSKYLKKAEDIRKFLASKPK